MQLSELISYAREKYQIEERHKWTDFPGFSVLTEPHTGTWVALLMRQWDYETGCEIERCDLKCGKSSLSEYRRTYLSSPIRMRGDKWISVAFEEETEADVVYRLFDRAVTSGEQRGFTIILDSLRSSSSDNTQRDTPLPFSGSSYRPEKEVIPDRIRAMRRLYEYGPETPESRAANFVRQGSFMADYEDDLPWSGDFSSYFPTYHDLRTEQLRGYFSWRTELRKGIYSPVPLSAAYIYIYELLNQIGTVSPEDSLQKMQAFEHGYLDPGYGDERMRQYLRRWMLEFAILNGLPAETVRQVAEPELMLGDRALSVLRSPSAHTDEEIADAILFYAGKKLPQSPVLNRDPERGKHLFSAVWRVASERFHQSSKDLFTLCFGEQTIRPWRPLASAVYHPQVRPVDGDFELDPCRLYRCRNGLWKVVSYESLFFDKNRFQGLLHAADQRFRRYCKTGHPLREVPSESWALPFIEAVIDEDRRAVLEAARPRITLDLSGLDQIRQDALTTRDSLLTQEELDEILISDEPVSVPSVKDESVPAELLPGLPLDPLPLQILHQLLQGKPVSSLILENRLMPSILADTINEALFDEIGDTVLLCENDELSLVEDYREDLTMLLGGNDA